MVGQWQLSPLFILDNLRLVQREIKYTLDFYYVYCYKLLRKDMDVNEYERLSSQRVSDCCFNTNSTIFQLYHIENKLIFNQMMMRSALYQTNTLGWIFIVLSHQNNSLRIDMSPNSDILSLSLMLRVSRRSNKINFIFFGLTLSGLEPTIYRT